MPWGVRRHIVEQPGKSIAERAAHLSNLLGGAVQCATDHQENPLGVAPARLLGHCLGGGLAKGDCLHRTERDASRLQHGRSSPYQLHHSAKSHPRGGWKNMCYERIVEV